MTTRSIVFFNQIHVYFTFALILFNPAAKSWLKDRESEIPYFHVRWLFVFFFIFAFTLVGQRNLGSLYGGMHVKHFVLSVFFLMGMHHSYAQDYGISMLYNRQLESRHSLLPSQKIKVRRLEQMEKSLIFTMMWTQFLFVLFKQLPRWSTTLNQMSLGICLLCALGLILISTRYPHSTSSNKTYFMMRFLFYPFIFVSFACASARAALHGAEYYFVYNKIASPKGRLQISPAIAFVAAGTVLILFNDDMLGWMPPRGFLHREAISSITTPLALAAATLHYHFDALLFKMKSPVNRKHILPLLVNLPSNSIGRNYSSEIQLGQTASLVEVDA